MSDTDSKIYTTQYFERAVFEMHPENSPPNDVLLSLLGSFRYKEKYSSATPKQVPNTLPGSQLFPQTGKRLGGTFLRYWQSHGGLAQQGYPISDEFIETSATNGKIYKVQYFERAVFEAHPENPAPNDVLLSLLGTFRLRAKYGDGSSLPPAPLFSSGGLGLSRAEWEKRHGPGGEGMFGTTPDRDGYNVVYTSDRPDGLIGAISKGFDTPVSVAAARAAALQLAPAYAQPIRLNKIDGDIRQVYEIYDTYISQSLGVVVPPGARNVFTGPNGPDVWNGAQPGSFTVKYSPGTRGASTIAGILIFLGIYN